MSLRVALVGPPLANSGGIGRVMTYALGALDPRDVEVRVLDTRGAGERPWTSLFSLVRSCAALVRHRRSTDVVHVNISSHGSAIRKGLVVRVCRWARLPVVLHLHASSFPEFFTPLPGWAKRWVRRTFALAGRVVVLGDVWRDYAIKELAVRAENITVLPNATPHALAAGARRPGEDLSVLFLGRLGTRKGVPELLDALAGVQGWRATLAGDGDVDRYRARATELGLADRIDFPGWVGPDAVAALLAQAHVLVLPSHAEGLPMSVLEAFAAGVPVVCTPVGGLPEAVTDGRDGLVVPVGDAAALAAALRRLAGDEPLRARLAAGALATWERDFSIDRYAGRLLAEWRRAAGHAPAPLTAVGG